MSNRFSFVARKFRFELDGLLALAKYPIHKDALIARLAGTLPGLSIEMTNICNANCTFCAYQYQERPIGVMPIELFRKIIADYAECGGGDIGLTPTVGDPLVDPHIVDRIEWARSVSSIQRIGMYSNMISLGRFDVDRLVHSGLNALTVSTSGFDEAMYRRVYRSKMYKKVLNNILIFARANNAAGRPVDFSIDMRLDRPIKEVRSSADYKAVEALVGAERMNVKFRYDDWGGKIKQDQLSGSMKLRGRSSFRRPRISPCTELFSGPMIYWDGRVGACGCRDVNASELIIGDVAKSHLSDIWFGAEIAKLRQEFLTADVKEICRRCTHYNNLSLYLRKDVQKAMGETLTKEI